MKSEFSSVYNWLYLAWCTFLHSKLRRAIVSRYLAVKIAQQQIINSPEIKSTEQGLQRDSMTARVKWVLEKWWPLLPSFLGQTEQELNYNLENHSLVFALFLILDAFIFLCTNKRSWCEPVARYFGLFMGSEQVFWGNMDLKNRNIWKQNILKIYIYQ